MLDLDALNFDKGNGLVIVVAIDAVTGAVLMVAHADRSAIERTIATGEMHYRSRTRGEWHKGATSGFVQRVVSLAADCDGDTVLARVEPAGPACHTGTMSCFGGPGALGDVLTALDATIASRAVRLRATGGEAAGDSQGTDVTRAASRTSYTKRLLADRNLRLKKLGEEATELALACAEENAARAAEEGADLVYHALVALRAVGVSLDDLRHVLHRRARGG